MLEELDAAVAQEAQSCSLFRRYWCQKRLP